MKVNDTVQLLEASKSVASVIPVVGTQLAAAIDLTIKVCKLIEVRKFRSCPMEHHLTVL